MTLREELKQFSKWAGFMAILTIIGGGLQALSGVFFFLIGAIPGIIMIIVGIKLWNAKKQADEIVDFDGTNQEEKIQLLINNLTTYFKIQGVLFIIGIAFFIIMFIIGIAAGGFSMLNNSMHPF
ncbi:DUF5362 family protein [Maledivibacter halophilus]|uniref:DUF5362 domain-containing protein n=1 Tax=Maledivibacter halophilus TaxID=36842 RepID=A0A1T5IIA3_9FIRM|nr:DUF5362 family protein [Maledivibacter halophilus]SKC38830.1 hypothetical protein SAMN02194393_00405 [Maledivibacter halophilus]